ncbi:MAG: HEAT repeat domain-containing protein [Spirochaetes bacterium]|nr:HEAT repeat domain-containing protein [Spirochaetota bacterium]
MKRNIITAILLLILGVVWIFFNKPSSIYWKEGARLTYEFKYKTFVYSSSGIKTENGVDTYGKIELNGTLNLRVLDINSDQVKAAVQLSGLEVKYQGKKDRDLEELYSNLFYVTFLKNGKIESFDFSNNIAEADRKSVKNVLRLLQFIVPDTYFNSWSTEENDNHGLFAAEYNYGKKLKKSKSKYLEIYDRTGNINLSDRVDIKKSSYECDYGYPEIWMKSFSGREHTVFYNAEGKVAGKFLTRVEAKAIPYLSDNSLTIWNYNIDPYKDIQEWNKLPIEKNSVSRKREIKRLKKQFGEKEMSDVIDALFAENNKFSTFCVSKIITYFKLYPESALVIPDIILNKKLNTDQRAMLINALQCERGDYAQKALVRIMEGGNFSRETRVQSAIALGDSDNPDDNILSSMWHAYYNRDNNSRVSKLISDTSILSLGRIASQTFTGKRNENANTTLNQIKNKINEELSNAEEPGQLTAAIYAAANTGDNEFIEPIKNFLKSEKPVVRSAAASSLAVMRSPGIDQSLADMLETEGNVNVRTSIVRGLYGRKVSDEAVQKVCKELKYEDNDIVRGEIYRFLLKNRKKDGVKETLREMQKYETSFENKHLISRALASRK